MLPPCGTFHYAAKAPSDPMSSLWDLALLKPVIRTGSPLGDKRLVGYAPKMKVEKCGLRPDALEWRNQPSVMLSKVTLNADHEENAQAASVSFFLDSALIHALHPGDRVFMSRTASGGLGISAVRGKQLIFAAGTVSGVPLGDNVKAQFPRELIDKAEAIFRKYDPDFEFPEYPLEIQIGRKKRIMYRGSCQINGYQVYVRHSFRPGEDADPECAAISLNGACPAVAANASAELLDHGGMFEIHGW